MGGREEGFDVFGEIPACWLARRLWKWWRMLQAKDLAPEASLLRVRLLAGRVLVRGDLVHLAASCVMGRLLAMWGAGVAFWPKGPGPESLCGFLGLGGGARPRGSLAQALGSKGCPWRRRQPDIR